MMQTPMPAASALLSRARRQAICHRVLQQRYAWGDEHCIEQIRKRVARGLAMAESPERRSVWEGIFLKAFRSGFIPGGRIQAAVGTRRPLCLINCFVQPLIRDTESQSSVEDVAQAVDQSIRDAGVTMRWGGGVGYDLTVLPAQNSPFGPRAALGLDPISVLLRLDRLGTLCTTHGFRKAAQMAVLGIDHPDIETFIDATQHHRLLTFNLSVAVSDDFMRAVQHDQQWTLASRTADVAPSFICARSLWNRLLTAMWNTASPGIIFIDQVRRDNNLGDTERLDACNPCGEQYLPDYGACDLGSIDLTKLVRLPFSPAAHFDFETLATLGVIGVRALDNALDLTTWPLPQQAMEAHLKRRIGLGVTGLADALFMLGLRYDRAQGRSMARRILTRLRNVAYQGSSALARERGAFPLFDAARHLRHPHAASRLPVRIKSQIARDGLRNSHLLALAPTGSISVALAGNVSSGIEPIFAPRVCRHLHSSAKAIENFVAEDFSARLYRLTFQRSPAASSAWCDVSTLSAMDHLRMMTVLQPFIDGAISKTVNLRSNETKQGLEHLLWQAWEGSIKGISVFRPTAAT